MKEVDSLISRREQGTSAEKHMHVHVYLCVPAPERCAPKIPSQSNAIYDGGDTPASPSGARKITTNVQLFRPFSVRTRRQIRKPRLLKVDQKRFCGEWAAGRRDVCMRCRKNLRTCATCACGSETAFLERLDPEVAQSPVAQPAPGGAGVSGDITGRCGQSIGPLSTCQTQPNEKPFTIPDQPTSAG